MRLLFLLVSFYAFSAQGADLEALKTVFAKNFNTFYEPRFCGKNIERFIREAQRQSIDLTGAYALQIKSESFWNTSAFYGREKPNERTPLGYFHFVFVAEGHVFDFDLNQPIALPEIDYWRLQFTAPIDPYYVIPSRKEGALYAARELESLKLARIEWSDYLFDAKKTWVKFFGEVYSIGEVLERNRERAENFYFSEN